MEGLQNLQWYDYLRIATAVLAIAAMFRLCRVIRRRKGTGQEYTTRLRDFLWLMFAFLFGIAFASIEALGRDTSARAASVLFFICTLVALHATRRSDETLIE